MLFVAACGAIAIVAFPVTSAAKKSSSAGQLDRAFSRDGKVVTVLPEGEAARHYANYILPFEFAPGRVVMAAHGGKVTIANGTVIVQYLADGRRNPRFGGGGAVPIAEVEGSDFQLADVAVDSQGRVLIAGTTKPTSRDGMSGHELPGPIPTVATIKRYLPSGQPDPAFGAGGVLDTTFGAQPPTFEGRPYPEAAVAVFGLIVDSSDRPVLSGTAVSEIGRCGANDTRYQATQGIVARLTPSGSPDPTFGANGLVTVGGLSWLASPTFAPSRIVTVGANVDHCSQGGLESPSVLATFNDAGSIDGGFEGDGFWSRPFTRIASFAVASSGKLVLLTRTSELSKGKWVESAGELVRLRANGSFDRSFGRRGRAALDLPKRGSVSAIAVDARDRVLLVGQVWSKRRQKLAPHPLRSSLLSSLLLMRTTKTGEPDRGFGRKGRVRTSFGAKTKVRATDVLLAKGRIVSGAKTAGPRANGFALARYLGG